MVIPDGAVVVEGSGCDEKSSLGVLGRLVSTSSGVGGSSSGDRCDGGTTSPARESVAGEGVAEGFVGISGCSEWAVSS